MSMMHGNIQKSKQNVFGCVRVSLQRAHLPAEDEHAAWKHPKDQKHFVWSLNVSMQHAHLDGDVAFTSVTMTVSMRHGTPRNQTKGFLDVSLRHVH